MPVKIHQFTVQANMKNGQSSSSDQTNASANKVNITHSFTKEEIIDICMEKIAEKLERNHNLKLD